MKIMIVEDDAALREIYSIRIAAEGYDVVTASDGEEALSVAAREMPDLILSDVMMPKISGFDMLDILRQTPETAKIKIIMMTALSSDDQRMRGEQLGADRYLVKSQVGIEDVVNAIHDVLGDMNANVATQSVEAAPAAPNYAPAVNPQATMPTASSVTQPSSGPVQQNVLQSNSLTAGPGNTSAAQPNFAPSVQSSSLPVNQQNSQPTQLNSVSGQQINYTGGNYA